jgi:hypothetical protein
VNWIEINKSILSLKFNGSEKMKLEISKNIDFNDDLREKEGIIQFSKQQEPEPEVKNSQIKM